MCGIAGIWNFDGKPISEDEITGFTNTLQHRGPDGIGIWRNAEMNVALGHRRLAIIDLSQAADQPLHDHQYHIVFNGEIFNFIEIRNELKSKGYVFKTDSDTEVILKAYHEWKEQMLLKFNGMWALVIYDESKQECFIARDRFGIKPFLYTLNQQYFAFASEQKSFLKLPNYAAQIDKTVAAHFLKTGFGVEGSEFTMFRNVHRLQAGHYAVVKNGSIRKRQWWNTLDHVVAAPKNIEEQAEQFRELFFDSVSLRLRSDVPVGSSLSGGFDSSAVVSAIAHVGKQHSDSRQAADWQQTFVATFPGKSNDERPQAEEVIRYNQIKGHFFEVKEEESLKLMNEVLYDFDDVYVGIPIAPWLIYRELRRNKIVVSLDGHGADELMGGYMHADGAYISNAPSIFTHWSDNKRLLNEYFTVANIQNPTERKIQTLKLWFKYHPDFSIARNLFKSAKHIKDSFVAPTSAEFIQPGSSLPFNPSSVNPQTFEGDETNQLLYRMFHYDILPTILRNFDRVSMAHGIEIRMPFMDWRLVSFVFSLPGSSKIKDGYTKLVARKAMKGYMPESIRTSKVKLGFNAPMPEWFNGPLKPWINEVLSTAGNDNELVKVKQLKAFIDQSHQSQNWNWSTTGNAWKYLHYLWYEQHFLKHG